MDEIMLNASKLVLGYDGKPVLHFSGMALPRGGQCLVAGPSGCGKTTLLYALAGLVQPIEGSIRIDDTDITALSETQRDRFRGRHIGIIFQTLHLVRSLTVMENLRLASYVAELPDEEVRARELLAQLRLAGKADVLPEMLSQGQAQRVAIARAVLHKPALLLADEPTSSLDDNACEDVITLIKTLAAETQATLVISTHDARVKKHFDNVINIGGAV